MIFGMILKIFFSPGRMICSHHFDFLYRNQALPLRREALLSLGYLSFPAIRLDPRDLTPLHALGAFPMPVPGRFDNCFDV